MEEVGVENKNTDNIGKNDLDNDDGDMTMSKRVNTPCEMCKTSGFKYKCPRCQRKTCSMACVKQHKKKFDCSGVKDKFTSTLKTEQDLRKDIRFLNEGLRVTNNSSKKVFLMNESTDEKKEREKKNKYLRKCAKKFRNINLINCPSAMSKFAENKSYVDFKNKKFYWTVKFIFISENNNKHEYTFNEPFDDAQYSLKDIIKYFVENKQEMDFEILLFINSLAEGINNEGEVGNNKGENNFNNSNNETVENVLEKSQVLYRVNMKENNLRGRIVKMKKLIYEECDKNLPLKDLLEGKDILEYPEFTFLLQ